MLISATYICPVRGLASLEPPEPTRLCQVAKVARGLDIERLAGHDLTVANWVSLIDPESRVYAHPPWVLRPGLERVGLIDQGLEPKEHVGTCLKEIGSGKPKDGIYDFIDISKQEYLDDPHTQLPRLWDHFRQTS
jgi:hypothetical protein